MIEVECRLCRDAAATAIVALEGRRVRGGNVRWQYGCVLPTPTVGGPFIEEAGYGQDSAV